ncbi:MAG: hypothetical protein KJZ86_14635 [Caldilineaceae bacterium]|nr:hypothetical protein [Caldilineaceae bacterium]HRJ45010.1 hypothetical protein [Caldilineaceae bacterium]
MASTSGKTGESVPPATLIHALAQSTDARGNEALIPLFLRHPEYHHFVPAIVCALDTRSEQTLRHFYTAAVYLQHLWHGSLTLYLGAFAELPDYFGENDFGLPSPQAHWGEVGLRQLAARFGKETGVDWLTVYESAIARFFAQQQLQSTGKP